MTEVAEREQGQTRRFEPRPKVPPDPFVALDAANASLLTAASAVTEESATAASAGSIQNYLHISGKTSITGDPIQIIWRELSPRAFARANFVHSGHCDVWICDARGPNPYTSTMALTDEDVGRNVRDLRVERKMTQAALASRVYLDRTAISRLESGQRTVTAPELATIASALGVDIGSLAATSGLSAPAAHMTYARPRPVESSRPQWLQIHIRGAQMDFLVGPGPGWVPAIALVDTSEAPVTKVLCPLRPLESN